MKKLILSICLGGMVLTSGFSQVKKPLHAKKFPAIMTVSQDVQSKANQDLFQQYYQTTDADDLRLQKTFTDEVGMSHQKFQQYYKGIPVEGATVTMHGKAGNTTHLSGNFRAIDALDTKTNLSKKQALQAALNHVDAKRYMWEEEGHEGHAHGKTPEGELVVYVDPEYKSAARLAYKLDIYAAEPLYRAWVYIDANTGEFIADNLRIHCADVNATGTSLYNGTVSFQASTTTGGYRLRQATNGVETYDLNNGTNYNNASDVTSSSTNFSGSATGVQAHWGAESTHAYFLGKHGRDSYNGNGATIRSYFSYSSNYVNAFWDGSRMTYGDGDGVNYGPLVSLDIVGHEITHGVTEYTANLVYSYESGALNESFSDIFGESIENYAQGSNDWLMGDHIGAGGSGGALRSMSNPNQFGDPDTYGGTNWYTGSGDNGGVHINSGVQNKWFYILTVGEAGTNDLGTSYNVTGIGMEKAAAIAYRNLSVYLNSSSNYAAARAGALQAAADLYGAGSAEYTATGNAWCAVGVGECNAAPPTCDDGVQNGDETGVDCGGADCAPCPCNDVAVSLALTTDNYGSETAWTVKSGGVTVESGTGYANNTSYNFNWNLPAGDYIFEITDTYGDGICCSYGTGSYTLTSGGNTIATGGAFGTSASHSFCTGGDTPIPGCTDASAHNYDPDATEDDGSCETCSDGVLNGDETDVDCGGALCAPCHVDVPGCTDASAHNYDPNATTDDGSCETCTDGVKNGDETDVDCGGALCSPCNTDVPGCTDATAHNYDPEATTDDGSCETCSDGVLNGDETGVDCGGALCSPCSTGNTQLFAAYFETGWDGFTDGGNDCARYSGVRSYEGSYSIRLRDNSGSASEMSYNGLDLSSYSSLELQFFFYPNSMENNEDFFVQVNGTTVAAYARGVDFDNDVFYEVNLTISAADANFTTNSSLSFQCDASGNGDRIYIDQVILTGVSGTVLAATTSSTIKELSTPTGNAFLGEEDTAELTASMTIFPNPANDYLKVSVPSLEEATMLTVYDLSGRAVMSQEVLNNLTQIDVSKLTKGLYFVTVRTEDGVQTQKFLKH